MQSYNGYSSGMAERKLTIEAFTGIDQSHGLHSADIGSSPDATNFIARDGDLRTCGGVSLFGDPAPVVAQPTNGGRIFQGYFRNATTGAEFSKLILCLDGRFYVADTDGEDWAPIAGTFSTNEWTMVNYREGDTDTVIFMNGINKGQMWDGASAAPTEMNIVQGRVTEDQDGTTVVTAQGETLYFSQLTLLNERLWGGVSADYPDRIYWSNTFE